MEKEYIININPRILELLGPHLYTNIYYILAELIANSYDAGAKNVYIIQKENSIVVEDDGIGMSYSEGDIEKYLDVAVETRTTEAESYVNGTKRRKIGRKGVGKLAALSVSENVKVMTIKKGEPSGFILSRKVGKDNKLTPLKGKEIKFEKISDKKSGTSIVMTNPQYKLNKSSETIKKNLLKIFPLVNKDFKIHIITEQDQISLENFDKEMIEGLGALITLGKDNLFLSEYFISDIPESKKFLLKSEESIIIQLNLKNKNGKEKEYNLEIKGWLGAYKSTSGKKANSSDFPDNFISLLSNGKLGEYNVLPIVGKNRLNEVFVVGQLHIDLFEETELPDMSLSNRQGYKTDDPRYIKVISIIERDLLPRIINLRNDWVRYKNKGKELEKNERQKRDEDELKKKVEDYKKTTSKNITERITTKFKDNPLEGIQALVESEMNQSMSFIGIKRKVDSQKKRVLISHTGEDKPLADIIYKMLSFNNIPNEDILYTSCEDPKCWIPHGKEIWEYLRDFFVDSISDEKIYVVYVTSEDMCKSWPAVSEVGAGWITKRKHDIFNIKGHIPKAPLNIGLEWHTSEKEGGNIIMNNLSFGKFISKILGICDDLKYKSKERKANEIELKRYVTIKT